MIEDFTTQELKDEVRIREQVEEEGICWFCSKNLLAHSCKFTRRDPVPDWDVDGPARVNVRSWSVKATHKVTWIVVVGFGASRADATYNCIKEIRKRETNARIPERERNTGRPQGS